MSQTVRTSFPNRNKVQKAASFRGSNRLTTPCPIICVLPGFEEWYYQRLGLSSSHADTHVNLVVWSASITNVFFIGLEPWSTWDGHFRVHDSTGLATAVAPEPAPKRLNFLMNYDLIGTAFVSHSRE